MLLQRSKPNLAKSYVSKCDLIVYDLHAGNPKDVKLAIEALAKPNKEEEPGNECILILISSLLAWDKTSKNLVEVKNPDEPDSDEEANKVEEVKEEGEKIEGEEGEAEMSEKAEDPPAPAEPSEAAASEKEGTEGEDEKEGEEGEEE